MPYTKILVHLVWATKKREPVIRKEFKSRLIDHIKANAKEKGVFIVMVNCHCDHVHCLISLDDVQNISSVAKLIKGESSRWINQQNELQGRFAWQEGYFAVSVSESVAERVKEYIRNQEEHHRMKSFEDESQEFLRLYGFKSRPE